MRQQGNVVARSLASAIAGLHDALQIFGPMDIGFVLDRETEQRRNIIDAKIAAIIEEHELSCSTAEIRAVILAAAERYWELWALHCDEVLGLGDKSEIASLEGALRRAESLLRRQPVRNRLEKIADSSDPTGLAASPVQQLHYKFGDRIFESVHHSCATVTGLLEIVQRAATADGRSHSASRRDDIRAATEPLRQYWVQTAARSGKLGQRGGIYFEAVRFLEACLALIDNTVTPRLIADLDK